MRDFFKKDWVIKVISVLVSIIIWIYVVYFQNPQYETWIKGVPVTRSNMSTDFSSGKLKILESNSDTVNIKVKGTRRTVAKLNNANIKVTADMISVTKDGSYTLGTNVVFPVSGITIVQKEPYNYEIAVDKVATSKLKIEVKKTGTLKSGYEIDTESITPETVSITAPQSILNTVSKAAVTVDISGKSSDIKGNYLIEFYNASGEKIVNPNISKSVEFAEGYFSLAMTKEVEIVPQPSNAEAIENAGLSVNINGAKTVKIKGKSNIISQIDKIYTKPFSFASISEGAARTAELDIPENVSLADGAKKTAEFTLGAK